MGKDTDRLLNKAAEHTEALAELEAEAAAAGRRLSEDDKAYLAELHKEGNAIYDAADKASKQETGERLGRIVTQDTSGNLTIHPPGKTEVALSEPGDGKLPVAGGGRLA